MSGTTTTPTAAPPRAEPWVGRGLRGWRTRRSCAGAAGSWTTSIRCRTPRTRRSCARPPPTPASRRSTCRARSRWTACSACSPRTTCASSRGPSRRRSATASRSTPRPSTACATSASRSASSWPATATSPRTPSSASSSTTSRCPSSPRPPPRWRGTRRRSTTRSAPTSPRSGASRTATPTPPSPAPTSWCASASATRARRRARRDPTAWWPTGTWSGAPVTAWSNFQGPFTLHGVAAAALGIRPARLRLLTPADSGGSFGVKAGVYVYVVLLAIASRRFGVPVRWTEDRVEHLLASSSATERLTEVEAAFAADGELLGLRYAGRRRRGLRPRARARHALPDARLLTGAYRVRTWRCAAASC